MRDSRNLSQNSQGNGGERRAMIGTLRNVSLSLPSPSLVAAAAVQIPGRAPVDYFEPVVGGGVSGGPERAVAPFDGKRREVEGAIRRGIRKWPSSTSSNGCTMHSQKEFSCANSFSFLIGTFHVSTNRKTSPAAAAAVERKEIQIRIVSFRPPPPPSFNCPPTLGLISPSPNWKPSRAR